MALRTTRARQPGSLAPVGRLRLPRRPTLMRLVAVAALLTTATTLWYAGGRESPSPSGEASPQTEPGPSVSPNATDHPDARLVAPGDSALVPTAPTELVAPTERATGQPATPERLPVPAGLVGVPVRLADPTSLALLRPGDRVDLLSITHPAPDPSESSEPVELAAGALVLAADRSAAALLLAVTPEESSTVLAASVTAALLILLRP